MDALAKAIGERLKAERKRQGKTLTVVSWAAGCSTPELSQYENGQVLPSTKRLLNLAAALGVSVAELVPEPFRAPDPMSHPTNSVDEKTRRAMETTSEPGAGIPPASVPGNT